MTCLPSRSLLWAASLLALALALVSASGCKSTPPRPTPPAPESHDDWPAAPADGAPVSTRFQTMIGQGKRLGADIRVFNHTDKAIQRLSFDLTYYDAAGEVLNTFPHGMQAPSLLGAGVSKVFQLGGFVPPETRRIEARVVQVGFKDPDQPAWKAHAAPGPGHP